MLFSKSKHTGVFTSQASAALLTVISLLSACTPLPTSQSATSESPRPIPTLPAEKLLREQAANPKPTPSVLGKSSVQKSAKQSTTFSTSEVTDLLAQAEDKAVSAANLAQSAQSKEDWSLIINQWKRAIALLKPISASGAQKTLVQKRLAVYQSELAAAQQQAKTNPRQIVTGGGGSSKGGIPLIVSPDSPSPTPSPSPTGSPSPTSSPSPSASPSP